MSRIDELINELCPDGLKFLKLGDLEDAGHIKLGRGNVISKGDLAETPGDYPVFSSSAANNGEFGRYGKYMFDDERITWSVDGGGKFFYRPGHRYSVTNVCGWMKVLNPDFVSTKYLYYALINIWQTRTYNYTVKAHPSVIREDYYFPVPPIEVQREIVGILDKFMQLEAELEAELEARHHQLRYLIDSAYTTPNQYIHSSINLRTLGELGTFTRGSGLQKSDLSERGTPCIHYGQIHSKYANKAKQTLSYTNPQLANKLKIASPGNVILATTSEDDEALGKPLVWLGEGTVAVGGETYIYSHNQDPLFMTYFFRSHAFQIQKAPAITGTKVKRVHGDALAKMTISIPDIEIQRSIGKALSDLDDLVTDIAYGLPAEIAARRKQYEYYRDRLLTFQELEVV